MHLKLQSTFLSLKDFPDIDLPPFTLITGLNGTGKSHILKAIKEGRIHTDLTSNFKDEIRFYDWQTLMPQDTGTYDGRTWIQARSSVRDNVQGYLKENGNVILDIAKHHDVPTEHLKDVGYVSSLSQDDLTTILGDASKATSARNAIQAAVNQAGEAIRGQLRGNENIRKSLEEILKGTKRPLAGC